MNTNHKPFILKHLSAKCKNRRQLSLTAVF